MLAKLGVLISVLAIAMGVLRVLRRTKALAEEARRLAEKQEEEASRAQHQLAPCPRCSTLVVDGRCNCDKSSS